jgi:hypothetical protein
VQGRQVQEHQQGQQVEAEPIQCNCNAEESGRGAV